MPAIAESPRFEQTEVAEVAVELAQFTAGLLEHKAVDLFSKLYITTDGDTQRLLDDTAQDIYAFGGNTRRSGRFIFNSEGLDGAIACRFEKNSYYHESITADATGAPIYVEEYGGGSDIRERYFEPVSLGRATPRTVMEIAKKAMADAINIDKPDEVDTNLLALWDELAVRPPQFVPILGRIAGIAAGLAADRQQGLRANIGIRLHASCDMLYPTGNSITIVGKNEHTNKVVEYSCIASPIDHSSTMGRVSTHLGIHDGNTGESSREHIVLRRGEILRLTTHTDSTGGIASGQHQASLESVAELAEIGVKVLRER